MHVSIVLRIHLGRELDLLDVIEIIGRLNARPRVAIPGIPYFDDALICSEDLWLGCLRSGRSSRVEIDDIFD